MATTRYTAVPVVTLASGTEVRVPVHEVRGEAGDGPTLGLSAGLHGDEQVSTEILYRFVRELDARQLKGRLLVVPVANALAYESVTRHTPLDMQNLNRVFPGGGEGFFTHQLAALLVREFLDKLDYYVDFHAGGVYPTVDYVYITNAEALSRAFGTPVLFRLSGGVQYGGSSAAYMRARNVPSVTVELGGGPVAQSPYVARGIAGIKNIMRTIGMLSGDPAPAPPQTVLRTLLTLRPTSGGMLVPEVTTLHTRLARDTVLGRTISPYSFEELEVFRAPFEPSLTVLVRQEVCRINPGDFGYMIGDLSTAE